MCGKFDLLETMHLQVFLMLYSHKHFTKKDCDIGVLRTEPNSNPLANMFALFYQQDLKDCLTL